MARSVTPTQVLILLLGPSLLALSAWAWAGRSSRARFWVGRPRFDQLMLAVVPGLGLVLTSIDMAMLVGESPAILVAAAAFLLGGVLEVAGMLDLLPRWWGPAWFRRLPPDLRRSDPTRSALAAAGTGYLGKPRVSSTAEARRRIGRARPIASWRGGWVYDADTDERPHAMARKGTVDGRLTLYPKGVMFAASRAEDSLRGRSTVLLIPAGEITGVEVVAPRAGADGRPRPGRLYRSWFSRLVIRTRENAHVFEIGRGRAGEVAKRLAAISAEAR